MSVPGDDFAARRAALAAKIDGQRGELARAYQRLEKPIHYAEYGMRGFGFLQSNPWVFVAAPAVVNILSTVFGGRKRKSSKSLPSQEQTIHAEKPKRGLQVWASRAVHAYQFYRRVRQFFP
jgi:hypothetical protein